MLLRLLNNNRISSQKKLFYLFKGLYNPIYKFLYKYELTTSDILY